MFDLTHIFQTECNRLFHNNNNNKPYTYIALYIYIYVCLNILLYIKFTPRNECDKEIINIGAKPFDELSSLVGCQLALTPAKRFKLCLVRGAKLQVELCRHEMSLWRLSRVMTLSTWHIYFGIVCGFLPQKYSPERSRESWPRLLEYSSGKTLCLKSSNICFERHIYVIVHAPVIELDDVWLLQHSRLFSESFVDFVYARI